MRIVTLLATGCLLLAAAACSKSEVAPNDVVPQDVLDRIARLGFSTDGVQVDDEGYLVEGDIVLTIDQLYATPLALRVPDAEQYHTFNLVTGMPREITISIDSRRLPASYGTALDEAISRYNAQNLALTMRRVSSGANIAIVRGIGSYLASAGFPTSSGNPYSQVRVNSRAIGNGSSSTFINYVATILAHEIGHCIGFRHTDWYNRSISCGGSATNEGQETSGVGAVHIPNTPDKTSSNADPGSFMLSCIGSGVNRPFTAADRTALNCMYDTGTPCTD